MSDELKPEPIRLRDEPMGTEMPEVDVPKLPPLPPPGSKAWGRSRIGSRVRWLGCGCGVIILIAAIITAYLGLRDQVWSSYTDVRRGLEHSLLVDVDREEKQRLLDNLELFETVVSNSNDPYPAIGRFVRAGREALADFVVDPEEAVRLSRLLEEELAEQSGDPAP